MEIKCPNCGSRFNLPDQLAKPGVKLRCSVCKTVFTYEPEVPLAEQGPLPEMPIKKKLPLVKLALIFVLVLACAGGGWYYYSLKSAAKQPNEQEIAKQVELLTMRNAGWLTNSRSQRNSLPLKPPSTTRTRKPWLSKNSLAACSFHFFSSRC